MVKVIKYSHFGTEVSVIEEVKGKHKEHCLCWANCKYFFPGDKELNCTIARQNYEMDVKYNLVTPVYECQKYEERV